MNAMAVPLILASIGIYALLHEIDVFAVFLRGVEGGLKTVLHILPTLIALLTAVMMLRASGFIDLAGRALEPIFTMLGIPSECTALVLLKPLSGSGGLALGSEIMRSSGVDSYAGRVAAVMLGASETSLYTIGVYCGHLKLSRTRYAIPAAFIADITAFIFAAACVRWMG